MTELFGTYGPPFAIEHEGHRISVDVEGELCIYRRTCEYETLEKVLSDVHTSFFIGPVEPVNLPKAITHTLLIEFQRPVMAAPGGKQKIFLKFPVEIGIFISGKNGEKSGDHELIDIFSLVHPKYTLYGTSNRGKICRYWKSDVGLVRPLPDPRYEGDLELDIINDTDAWIEITKVVLNAYAMRLYYGMDQGHERISTKAFMKIINRKLAETGSVNYSGDMNSSVSLYAPRKHILNAIREVMEYGL